jgi:hypothetical protein
VRERLQTRRGLGIKWVPGYGYVTPASTRPTVNTETVSWSSVNDTSEHTSHPEDMTLPGAAD